MSFIPRIGHALRSIASLAFLSLVWTTVAHGEAFRILDQGASATGQGAAFAAQADDPSAIHYNPAGMTQLRGVQFYAGTNLIGGHITFNPSGGGNTVEGNFGGTISNPPPSQIYLTANLEDLGLDLLQGWTAGIGVTSPFGVNTRYPATSQVSTVTATASLPLLDIKPTVAFKLNEYLSIGGGLDIYTFSSFIGEGQAQLTVRTAPAPNGTVLEANGTDTAVGFNASFLFTPFRNAQGKPLVNLAFVYRSPTDLNLEGKFLSGGTFIANAKTTIELPQIVKGAIAVWPIRNQSREWKVEVDFDYADWTRFKNLNLTLSNGFVLPQPRNYGDAYVVMVGTEHKWLELSSLPDWDLALRAGYIRSQTPIPSSTFEPGVPDSDFNAISVGWGMLCKGNGAFLGLIQCSDYGLKAIGLDLAYQVLLYQERGISNNIQLPPDVLNGTWDTIIHIGAMNLRVNF